MSKLYVFVVTICCLAWPCDVKALSHVEGLSVLKNKGFQPKVVYDIGAFHGDWTTSISSLFKDAQFFLFEANEVNEQHLQKKGFPYFIKVLGNYEGPAIFYSINGTGDSLLREQTYHYTDNRCEKKLVQVTTLDNLVRENRLPLPDLIKMDVQGAETMIIQGGEAVVCNAEVIILEIKILEYNENAPLIYETMTIMDRLGYQVLDIVELHYLRQNELFEVDLLFAKKESLLIRRGTLITEN